MNINKDIITGDCFAAWVKGKTDSIILCYAQKAYNRVGRGRAIEGHVINTNWTIWFNNGENQRHKFEIIPIKIQNCRMDYNKIINHIIDEIQKLGLI